MRGSRRCAHLWGKVQFRLESVRGRSASSCSMATALHLRGANKDQQNGSLLHTVDLYQLGTLCCLGFPTGTTSPGHLVLGSAIGTIEDL